MEQKKHYNVLELDKVLARLAEFCVCNDAKERAFALSPAQTLEDAQQLMNETTDAHHLLARFGSPSFGGLRSIANALARAATGGMLSLRELLDTTAVLGSIRGIIRWRENCAGVETVLDFSTLEPNAYLEKLINDAIANEEELSDNASPALADLRRKIRVQESRVREQLEKTIRSANNAKILQETIVTQRGGRYVVPVKAEMRGEFPGLVHDFSASGATVFVEPIAVVEANNEIRILRGKERAEVERIVLELSARVGEFAHSIRRSYEAMVALNLVFAKAQYAYKIKACAPELNDRGETLFREARHPLLPPESAVPIDISLGIDFDTLVITGPNTGGKTVALKTLGLLSLMARCGLMLPVRDGSRAAFYPRIYADIGDEQSIEQSLSTFSAHMTNITAILAEADWKSLVLADELGAGTDPVEGAALAQAILESLREKGAHIAATTHYAELKAYALTTARVQNASCEFDVQTLRPTYRLIIGTPGRSNALAISERLGIERQVLNLARSLIAQEDRQFEEVVDRLEASRRAMEAETESARNLKNQVQAEREKAAAKRTEIEQLWAREEEQARGAALRIVEQAKREAAVLLAELDKLRKEKDSATADLAKRAKSALKKMMQAMAEGASQRITPAEDEDYVLPRPLIIGDSVQLVGMGTKAVVLTLPDAKGMLTVQTGNAKTRVSVGTVRLASFAGQGKTPAAKNNSKAAQKLDSAGGTAAENRIDLRGMTVEECLHTLEYYLDGVMRTGLHEFVIVHGKGTGALRTAVKRYLDSCSFIASHRLGGYGEGGDGVTVVTLR
ncbi:MAG: endonuclease MutS2 [Oscillospiraceae bacterium]|jgi:DNA mismatch repair protein MutS2|nr:endonuclease MutS2 [Oscillospiraceae bacterium]